MIQSETFTVLPKQAMSVQVRRIAVCGVCRTPTIYSAFHIQVLGSNAFVNLMEENFLAPPEYTNPLAINLLGLPGTGPIQGTNSPGGSYECYTYLDSVSGENRECVTNGQSF